MKATVGFRVLVTITERNGIRVLELDPMSGCRLKREIEDELGEMSPARETRF